jgi:hypothetical protein
MSREHWQRKLKRATASLPKANKEEGEPVRQSPSFFSHDRAEYWNPDVVSPCREKTMSRHQRHRRCVSRDNAENVGRLPLVGIRSALKKKTKWRNSQ